MSSALVSALTAPLLELQSAVGSGQFAGDDPARVLRNAARVLAEVTAAGTVAADRVGSAWEGSAAEAASQQMATVFATATEAAARASDMAGRVGEAADAVNRANAELRRIIDDFVLTATELERGLPETASALTQAARKALADATAVVAELEAELDGHAAAVTAPGAMASPPPAVGAPTWPAGLTSSLPAMPATGPFTDAGLGTHDEATMLSTGIHGSGVAVRLPDGSTVMAPNEVAAGAVRHALTQLGVPYDWGGTTPGVGLDCSGLTQWAYHEAGLDLPRLAQDQDVGTAVPPGSLLPGDLAVWDGHVAMVVGNGMMIEAGDPVQLSPIRTTNLNQGFQGFFRPSA